MKNETAEQVARVWSLRSRAAGVFGFWVLGLGFRKSSCVGIQLELSCVLGQKP